MYMVQNQGRASQRPRYVKMGAGALGRGVTNFSASRSLFLFVGRQWSGHFELRYTELFE